MNETTFSVKKRYWFSWFIILLSGSLFILYIGSFLLDDLRELLPFTIISGSLFLFFIAIFSYGLKENWPFPWKIKLTVTKTVIHGFDGNTRLNYSWDELIFIHLEPKGTPHLYFFADKSKKRFNLSHLPATDVWRSVQQHANPITLQESSYEQVVTRDIVCNEAKVADIKLPLVINWTFDKILNIMHQFVNFYSTMNLFSRQVRELTWGSGKNFKPPKPQVNSPENLISKCSVEYRFLSRIFMSIKLSKVQNKDQSDFSRTSWLRRSFLCFYGSNLLVADSMDRFYVIHGHYNLFNLYHDTAWSY